MEGIVSRCRLCSDETENFVVRDTDGDHFYCGRGSCGDALKKHAIEARRRKLEIGTACSFDEAGVGPCGRPSVIIKPFHGRCSFHQSPRQQKHARSADIETPAFS